MTTIYIVVADMDNRMDEYITDTRELGYFSTWEKAKAFMDRAEKNPKGYRDFEIYEQELDSTSGW